MDEWWRWIYFPEGCDEEAVFYEGQNTSECCNRTWIR